MKYIVVLNDWGYRNELEWLEKKGNFSIKCLAVKLVKRMPGCPTRWQKSIAFRKFFTAYKRNATGKTYQGMFSDDVKDHVWSYAVHIALVFQYDLDELEHDWEICIGGQDDSKETE